MSEDEKERTIVRTGLVLVKECTIIGSQWGAWASRNPDIHKGNFEQLMSWLRFGRIDPVIGKVLPLADAAEALSAMQRGEIRGKVLLKA